MDWTTTATTINGVLADAAPIMTALVAVAAGIMAFRTISSLITGYSDARYDYERSWRDD